MYITLLWTDDESFDIQNHESLKEAVSYLVKNGAKYENQKIVEEIDWMPSDPQSSHKSVKTMAKSDTQDEIGPPPGVIVPTEPIAPEQPALLDYSKTAASPGQPKRSMFQGLVPPQLLQTMGLDD